MTSYKGADMKQCSKCHELKSFDLFYNDKKSKDGKCAQCKDCRADHQREWCKNNREKHNAKFRKQYAKNPEPHKKRSREYSKNNPELSIIIKHKRRTKKISNGIFYIRKTFMRRLYLSNCAYCGSSKKIHADHIIPISKGGRHSEGNLQPLCAYCNYSKNDKLMMEWRIVKERPLER